MKPSPVSSNPAPQPSPYVSKHTVSALQRRQWEEQLLGHRVSRQRSRQEPLSRP